MQEPQEPQEPRKEGKTGTGGVFVTPSEVELAKTGSLHFLAGVARTQPIPVFPSPTPMFAQSNPAKASPKNEAKPFLVFGFV